MTIPKAILTSYESDGTTSDDCLPVKGSSAYDSDDSEHLSKGASADSKKGRKLKKGASASDSEESDSSSKGTSGHDSKTKGASADSPFVIIIFIHYHIAGIGHSLVILIV